MLPIKLKLPDHFLDEEIRCGYTISSKMKKVWAVELDLLNEFQRVCKKYNLTYFTDSGTTIGAIRHQGFIPWDDDIDVVMLRHDYDKLQSIAASEFKHPYFFQTETTDPGSARGHIQLRNSETTGILYLDKEAGFQFNQGIFIDIFPLDDVPDDDEDLRQLINQSEEAKQQALKFRNYVEIYLLAKRLNFFAKFINKRKHNKFHDKSIYPNGYNHFFKNYEKIICQYNNPNSKRLANLGLMPYKEHRLRWREDYSITLEKKFEFMTVPVPVGYDRILSKVYGNWKIIEQKATDHGGVIFNPELSYINFL